MKKSYIILVTTLTLAACSNQTPYDHGNEPIANNIALRATVEEIEVATRSEVTPFTGRVSSANPLNAEVWFSFDANTYDNAPQSPTWLPIHSTINFRGEVVDPKPYTDASDEEHPLKYPTGTDSDKKVYCVGLAPVSVDGSRWESTDNKVATRPINGKEDLMFAPRIEGTWRQRFEIQQYEHLLTWVKINIIATSTEAIESWGKVKRIAIISNDGVEVTLGSDVIDYTDTFTELEVISTTEPAVDLSTVITPIGSTLSSPPTSTTTLDNDDNTLAYRVKVTTELGGDKEISVGITDFEDNAISTADRTVTCGKLYILELRFNEYDIVNGVCTLNSWQNQNENIYLQ